MFFFLLSALNLRRTTQPPPYLITYRSSLFSSLVSRMDASFASLITASSHPYVLLQVLPLPPPSIIHLTLPHLFQYQFLPLFIRSHLNLTFASFLSSVSQLCYPCQTLPSFSPLYLAAAPLSFSPATLHLHPTLSSPALMPSSFSHPISPSLLLPATVQPVRLSVR